MSKQPKSIVISFRLSPVVIAKAIDGLKAYNKCADITKLSTIIKQVTLHGINYMTNALPWEPTSESQRIVQSLTNQGKQGINMEQSILGAKSVAITEQGKENSYFEKTEKSLSAKSTVTDFSMPKKLKQEIEEQGNEDQEN